MDEESTNTPQYISLNQTEIENSNSSQIRKVSIASPFGNTDAQFINSQLKAESKLKCQLLILPMCAVFSGAGALISSIGILNVCTHPAKSQAKINKGQLTLCIISLFLCLIAGVVCILKTQALLKSKNENKPEETSPISKKLNPTNYFKKQIWNNPK
jgi:Na+/proline symporter